MAVIVHPTEPPAGQTRLDTRMLRVLEAFQQQLRELPPDAAQLGRGLIAKLAPPQWTLEWYLPRWLGDAFQLQPALSDELVLSNLFGLCYICLQDKTIDEDEAHDQRLHRVILSVALHQWWLAGIARVCGADRAVWAHLNRVMGQWWHATAVSNVQPAEDFAAVMQKRGQQVGHRASPLKVCCITATHLAHEPGLRAPLEQCLDHLHSAAVLLDHAQDWQDDLEAGRYNLFVHYCSSVPQQPDTRQQLARRLLDELWFGDGATPYFAYAQREVELALAAAEPVGCAPLRAHLTQFQADLAHYHSALVTNARAGLDHAAEAIFGHAATA